uniref:Uncharacterized protein n=1 Tax=Lepeophtheirus salmonis TaxID=72036 RepID=A0A0K2TM16_LEPSM
MSHNKDSGIILATTPMQISKRNRSFGLMITFYKMTLKFKEAPVIDSCRILDDRNLHNN